MNSIFDYFRKPSVLSQTEEAEGDRVQGRMEDANQAVAPSSPERPAKRPDLKKTPPRFTGDGNVVAGYLPAQMDGDMQAMSLNLQHL
jgi:hypothetical protein